MKIKYTLGFLFVSLFFTGLVHAENSDFESLRASVLEKRVTKEDFKNVRADCEKLKAYQNECLYLMVGIRLGLVQRFELNLEKEMPGIVRDLQTVIEWNEMYDRAGSYRTLAEIYLNLPRVPIWGTPWVQDLKMAWHFVTKALRLHPQDPQNLYVAAQIRLKQGDPKSALIHLEQASKVLNEFDAPKLLKNKMKSDIENAIEFAKNELK